MKNYSAYPDIELNKRERERERESENIRKTIKGKW